MCATLVLCSLLLVAGASAYLTQGQVRLTRLQQQLNVEFGRHRNLESRVAQLANPSKVVSKAQGDGLTAPSHVTDLPELTPTTAPVTPHTSTDTTVVR
jgi:cell division protein FtsL